MLYIHVYVYLYLKAFQDNVCVLHEASLVPRLHAE